jgi:hypothetical protein
VNLKVLSFLFTTKLKNVVALAKSTVEYITFDGESASTYITNHQFADLTLLHDYTISGKMLLESVKVRNLDNIRGEFYVN